MTERVGAGTFAKHFLSEALRANGASDESVEEARRKLSVSALAEIAKPWMFGDGLSLSTAKPDAFRVTYSESEDEDDDGAILVVEIVEVENTTNRSLEDVALRYCETFWGVDAIDCSNPWVGGVVAFYVDRTPKGGMVTRSWVATHGGGEAHLLKLPVPVCHDVEMPNAVYGHAWRGEE